MKRWHWMGRIGALAFCCMLCMAPAGCQFGDGAEGFIVYIDAGHGGDDTGAVAQGRTEKADNLRLALAVARQLEAQGATVLYARRGDENPSLQQRCAAANDAGASVFLSLHRNYGGGEGVEVWIHSRPSAKERKLAEGILQRLEDCGIACNRGMKTGTPSDPNGDFTVNLRTDMPSCIVELGFMDSAYDNRLFDERLEAYAAAIAQSVLALR